MTENKSAMPAVEQAELLYLHFRRGKDDAAAALLACAVFIKELQQSLEGRLDTGKPYLDAVLREMSAMRQRHAGLSNLGGPSEE